MCFLVYTIKKNLAFCVRNYPPVFFLSTKNRFCVSNHLRDIQEKRRRGDEEFICVWVCVCVCRYSEEDSSL